VSNRYTPEPKDELGLLPFPLCAPFLAQRLQDLSRLMKMISEPIARRANAVDKTSGRFWQGLSRRFGAAGARRLKRPRQGAEGWVA